MTEVMQTELHRHLDVSMRAATLLELAQKQGLEAQSTSLDQFKDQIYLRSPLEDLNAVLEKFTYFQKVYNHPDVIERFAFESIEDCYVEGTRAIEFRYSPSFVSGLSKISWDEALDAIHRGLARGIKKYPEMRAGLICIASREYGADQVEETIEFFLRKRDQFIGIDLAGNEDQYPCRLFEKSFKKAIGVRAKITIHSGEASGPENIWEALEYLGAQRIGHGVRCTEDPKLMTYLREKQICLEICPTSNWLTRAVPSLATHPLPRLLREGLAVSINTDDPGVFPVTLPHEYQVCQDQMGMTQTEINQCKLFASNASFL
jgi:adenosine deaminase